MADYYGWKVSTYTQHENGTRAISRKAAEKYAQSFGVTMDFLLRGKGNTPQKNDSDLRQDVASQPIMVLSWSVISGAKNKEEMLNLKSNDYTYVPRGSGITGMARSIVVKDDSAVDINRRYKHSFSPGDEVIFDPTRDPQPGELVIAYHPQIKAAAPRIYAERQDLATNALIVELIPLNPAYPSVRMIKGDGSYICGVAIKQMLSI